MIDASPVAVANPEEDPRPFMTPAEVALLERHINGRSRVFEFGAGLSTLWLANRVRSVISVEHQAPYAARLIELLGDRKQPAHVSVIYAPPSSPYVNGGDDDGDWTTFRDYIETYTGRGIDVVIVDGRARVDAARFVMERAPFGPNPSMRIFVHDVQRTEYHQIWEDAPGQPARYSLIERVDNLVVLAPKFEGVTTPAPPTDDDLAMAMALTEKIGTAT